MALGPSQKFTEKKRCCRLGHTIQRQSFASIRTKCSGRDLKKEALRLSTNYSFYVQQQHHTYLFCSIWSIKGISPYFHVSYWLKASSWIRRKILYGRQNEIPQGALHGVFFLSSQCHQGWVNAQLGVYVKGDPRTYLRASPRPQAWSEVLRMWYKYYAGHCMKELRWT